MDKDLLQEESPFRGRAGSVHLQAGNPDSIFSKKPKSQLLAVWKGSGSVPPGRPEAAGQRHVLPGRPVASVSRNGSAKPKECPRSASCGSATSRWKASWPFFPGSGWCITGRPRWTEKRRGKLTELWIEHLLLQLARWTVLRAVTSSAKMKVWEFKEVAMRKSCWVGFRAYLKGLAAPLPFFPKSSFAFAIGPGPKTSKTAADLLWRPGRATRTTSSRRATSKTIFQPLFREPSRPAGAGVPGAGIAGDSARS